MQIMDYGSSVVTLLSATTPLGIGVSTVDFLVTR